MTTDRLRETYKIRYEQVLQPIALKLRDHVEDLLQDRPRIDRVTARAKSIDRFIGKAEKKENGERKYADPLNQIQDQIGARIVTYYRDDLEPLSDLILEYFGPIEKDRIVPDLLSEFGYEGIHFVLLIPDDLLSPDIPNDNCPEVFELQLKTLFQYAWAEANHDLAYKPFVALSAEQRRRVAFTAAQAWGADHIFSELVRDLSNSKRAVNG